MELGWGYLILLCVAGGLAWFWQDSLAARESANAAAMAACQQLGLQFLDGTVAFARLRLTREAGRLKLRRTYVFDYTAQSIERHQGFVLLTGARVESIGYAPGEPLPAADAAPAPASTSVEEGNVLDLQAWRTRKLPPPDQPLQPRQDH